MRLLTITAAALLVLDWAAAARAADVTAVEFFEKRVRPVFAEHCHSCHGPKRQQAGLRLDLRDTALKGSDTGPVVVPGDPDKSLLIQAVRYAGDTRMPPKGKLPPDKLDALAAWVKMGAPWPDSTPATLAAAAAPSVADARKTHWAFRPVQAPPLPAVRDAASPVDAFIRARLEAKGLTPSAAADRRTLIRRVSFDLIGLPPTQAETDAFVNDPSLNAFATVVERLLASPHYGERWGRHWLDLARYADTKGYVFQEERRYPYAYTYRSYVIRALNDDLPYDQFILQQLAADKLPLGDDKRPLAAMGFLTLGRRFLNNAHDIIDDRIDVVSRGLLGLTVSCARCHDHKFDPVPQKDYYSLYGVFASSVEPRDLPLLGPPEPTPAYLAFERELDKRKEAVTKFEEEHKAELAMRNRKVRDQLRGLQRRVDEWRVSGDGSPPCAMVMEDRPTPVTPRVFLRGNPNNPGDEVPRQFLEVVAGSERKPFTQGSGRLELARAIASRDNPLTARVLVNRVWMYHFGAGLVRTPSDFGTRSEPPSHPELLDYLAWRFTEDGWSIKNLHRLILLSSTYQQSSDDNAAGRQADPDNTLLWRQNRQRLDFEALRDALLAAAGRLDRTIGGPSVDLARQPLSGRRTVYGFIDRQNLPGLMRTFDFASPDTHSPQRYQTTVPQQALFLLNSPFVVEQARRLIGRADVAERTEPGARIAHLHRLLYGREATAEEVEMGRRFVAAASWERYGQVLLLANEFAFVD